MKILYVATPRTDAQAVAAALYSVAPTVKVLWATHFDHASLRINQNPDVAAVVAETKLDSDGFHAFLVHARGLGLRAPVVVVPPDGAPQPDSPLAGDGVHTAKNVVDLPGVIVRATARSQPTEADNGRGLQQSKAPAFPLQAKTLDREQPAGPTSPAAKPSTLRGGAIPPPADVQALLDRARRATAADTSAADRLAQWQALDARLADAARSNAALQSRLAELEAVLREREQTRAVEHSAAAEREASLDRLVQEERAARETLEHELVEAKASLQDAEQQHQSALTAAADRLAEREAKHEIALACAAATRDMVDEQMRRAAVEVQRARQDQASVLAEVEQLRRREDQLVSQLSDAVQSREALEQQLTETESALNEAHEGANRERQIAGAREAELASELAEAVQLREALELRLTEAAGRLEEAEERFARQQESAGRREAQLEELVRTERATRADVEQNLSHSEAALRELEDRHASAMIDAAATLAESHALFDADLTEAVTARTVLEQRAQELGAALVAVQQDYASATADVERLKQREADVTSELAEAVRGREALELRLSGVVTALREADDRAAREWQTAAARESELASQLSEAIDTRQALEKRLTEAGDALKEADDRAARERQAAESREAELASQVAEAASTRNTLEEQAAQAASARSALDERVRELTVALSDARCSHESATADVDRLKQRESDLSTQLADAVQARQALELDLTTRLEQAAATREAVEQRLTEATEALKEAEERATRDREAAEGRQAELTFKLTDASAIRQVLELRATELATALKETDERASRERQAAEIREAELASQLADAASTRNTLEEQAAQAASARSALDEQVRELTAALSDVRRSHESATATVETLKQREADLAAQLTDAAQARQALEQDFAARLEEATAIREAVEQRLTEATAALKEAEERATRDREAADAREAELTFQLTDASVIRQVLELRATETATALKEAEERAASERAAAGAREAELDAQLGDAGVLRQTLEHRLAESAVALKDADERTVRERLAASERQSALEARLVRETEQREALERAVAETRSAAAEAAQRFQDEATQAAARARAEVAGLEQSIANERRDHENRRVGLHEQIRRLTLERDALSKEIGSTQERLKTESEKHLEIKLDLQRALAQASNEHAVAAATFVATVNERDARIKEQAARHAAALQSSDDERTQLQAGFRTTLATRNREIEQLKGKLTATMLDLDALRTRHDVLQAEASRVPILQKRLDDSLDASRRRFETSPLPLCRCTRGGELVEANRAFEVLIGCRKAGELRGDAFADSLFESPRDLSWLIERCLGTNARQSVETTWKHRNGTRLFVRLSAVASSPDLIQLVAEDLTTLRAIQDRLGQAQRMEAVGRLASEVAVTCGNLLNEIHQDVEQWLATVSSGAATRQQGQLVLDQVKRAAGFLRQLAVYGDDEISSLAPIDLNKVLRDLEPVLKRVAGEDVELEIPKTTSSLKVDVKPKRLERLLVNLAGYCRERLPNGGCLKIELGTIVVDGQFIAKHPNVRLGPHALITVKETRREMHPGGPLGLRTESAVPAAVEPAVKSGVDLGALQALISDCHGHLWMTVEPAGDMIAKIHLPLHASSDAGRAQSSVLRRSGSRLATRLLQN
jgi:hypothetical protein